MSKIVEQGISSLVVATSIVLMWLREDGGRHDVDNIKSREFVEFI